MSIKEKVIHLAGAVKKFAIDKSPEAALIGGIGMVVVGTVLACKQTLKVEDILDEHQEVLDKIEKVASSDQNNSGEIYTESDAKKDRMMLKARTGARLVKLYSLPALLIGGGIILICTSHGIMKKRYAALVAAYETLQDSYRRYRDRVIERYGEDEDNEFYNGIKKVTKEMAETADEDSQVHEGDYYIDDDYNSISPYARFFDESFSEYEKNNEYNRTFLYQIERQMNDLLNSRGYVFLNEVYDALGAPCLTQAGQEVGWLRKDKGGKDGYISFNIFNVHRKASRDFVNGLERAILLDFNVDGPIRNKLPRV